MHQVRSYHFFIVEIIVKIDADVKIENYYDHNGEQLSFDKEGHRVII